MVSGPPVTSCEELIKCCQPTWALMWFLADHLLFSLLLSICRGFQTGATTMFPGLGTASTYTAGGEGEGGAAREAGV